jgi:hypothetical protein
MMVSTLLLRVGILLLLVGMVAGIGMGIAQDFRLAPAHAHLNLIGGVLLIVSGLYYQVFPEAASRKLARIHATLAVVGAILFPIGIAIVLLWGAEKYEIFPIGGSLIVLAGMLVFAWIIFTSRSALRV